jgi:hypothetical protein
LRGEKRNVTKTFLHPLEEWDGGSSRGYYDFKTDEIHVLRGYDQERRTLLHEQIHASRRDKTTFRLAALAKNNLMNGGLVFLLVSLSIFGAFSSFSYFWGAATLYLGLWSCVIYEEYKAEKGTMELGTEKRY